MKEIVFKITHVNWGLIGPDSWNSVEWNIYNDLSVEINVSYNNIEKNKLITSKLSKKDYNNVIENVELSKDNYIKIDACDGSAWEIIEYYKGNEIWKRDLGYIYGIKPLEEVAKVLNKLVNDHYVI